MSILLCGDMIEQLTNIQDKSIRLFILDLPYNQTDLDFDKCAIPLDKLWKQLLRVGKENCCYLFFTTTKFGFKLIQSNPKLFRYDLVWNKQNAVGFLNAKKQPLRTHELIYVFYEKQPFYNLSGYKRINNKLTKSFLSDGVYSNKIINTTGRCYEPKLPVSILNFATEKYAKKRLHPTEKPIELYKFLINHFSDVNETVCDPCFGSANSLVACLELKRNFLGIELDPLYFEKGETILVEWKGMS